MSAPEFRGFPAEAFEWFARLEADNSKRFFDANRATYDAAIRGPVEAMLDELNDELGGEVKIFRQHRDVRFSKDKSPYKTTTYGVVRSIPDTGAPVFAQLSAHGLFVGSGYYNLDPGQLQRFRDAIVDERTGPALEQAVDEVHSAGVETYGESLKTAPRGYPRVSLLRHKSLFAGARLDPRVKGITRRAALGHVHRMWEAMAPLNGWLDRHVGPGDEPEDSRYRGRSGRR
jgi:uncharacterized protein (TIGR02453 family)